MVSPFEIAAQKIGELGFFNFVIPFFITLAVFYGLLKRSNLFSTGINALLSISVSFFIWGYLVTTSGAELGVPFSKFFTQTTVIILVFLFSLVGASMFYPDFNEALKKAFPGGQFVWLFFGILIVIFFVTSGLGNVTGIQNLIGSQAGVMVLVLFLLFIGVLIATLAGGGGGE